MKKIILLMMVLLITLSALVSTTQAHNYQQTKPYYSPHNPYFTVWYNSYSSLYWENTQVKVGLATVSQTYDPQWRATVDIYSYFDSTYYHKKGITSPWQYYTDSATSNPYSWTSGTMSVLSRKSSTRVWGKFEMKQCAPGYGCTRSFLTAWSQYPSSGDQTSAGHNHLSLGVEESASWAQPW